LDSLPAATIVEPKNITGLRAGLGEIERSFVNMLERNGIKRTDPTGTAFTPDLHQAVGEQEASGYAPGTVLQTLSPTWTLNGRLLRPAMVVVAKLSPEKAKPTTVHIDQTV
jgi:molecular chaperone GrpE